MPHKTTKSPGKSDASKAAPAPARRSIVARASKAVAKTRKAIGKVAGRTERHAVVKPAAPRPVRQARPAPRVPPARPSAGGTRGAKVSASPKKPAAKKASLSGSAPKAAAPQRVSGKKVGARARPATAEKVVAARKVAGAGKPAATKKVAAAAKARPQVQGVKRTAKAAAGKATRTARRQPVRAGAKVADIRPASRGLPRRGYTEERFLARQRNVLERERATYLEQASSLQEEAELLVAEMEPGDVQFDEESGEGGTVAVDRERDLTLSAQALEAVAEIEAALAKIENGTYGACEGCGELIAKARLEALPYARLCMACKSGGLSRR